MCQLLVSEIPRARPGEALLSASPAWQGHRLGWGGMVKRRSLVGFSLGVRVWVDTGAGEWVVPQRTHSQVPVVASGCIWNVLYRGWAGDLQDA